MRAEFKEKAISFISTKLKFIDEAFIDLGLTRLYGRAKPGQRVIEAVPQHSSPHLTIVAALGFEGVSAPWMLEGAMDTEAFEIWVKDYLLPSLQEGEIVLMDNYKVHKAAWLADAIASRGARLEYLPPYSPDLNPIEKCWSKIKTFLRATKARTVDELIAAFNVALATVSKHDALAWFVHCGYTANPTGT